MKLTGFALSFLFLCLFTSCDRSDEKENPVEVTIGLDSLLVIHPDSIPLLINKTEQLIQEYDYSTAMNYAARAFRLDTNNIEARHLYAEVLNNRPERSVKDIALAQKHYHYVIKEQPKNTKALVGLASTYSFQRDFPTSFQYINEALRIDKRYRDAYVLKGTNYRDMGETELMKSSYETAIQQDPEFFAGYFELGRIYQGEGNKVCIEYFTTALNLEPDNPEVKYQLAFSKQHFGQVEGAKEMYRKMATDTLDFYVSHALFQLGHIKQFYEEDLDSAIYFYHSAIQTKPDFVEAHHNMGMCYDLQGRKSLALKKFAEALKYDPEFSLSRIYADSIR